MNNRLLFLLILLLSFATSRSQDLIREQAEPGAFPLASATIYVEDSDYWLVQKAATVLQQDIERVTGRQPAIIHALPSPAGNLAVIILGSLDSSRLIRRLAKAQRIAAGNLKGKWESYLLQTIPHPVKGIAQALVITGSDRRGTAYGVFELSRQIGVSPWYWWADVPVRHKPAVYVRKGLWEFPSPAVKYRGFFINDEAPALSGWAKEKFGGLNHRFYEKVFELLLRMKANFLWPAMWGNAFNDDDTLNPVLADKYGIVMGTSHHEPMLRAQQEWKRYGKGPWDYTKNESTLQAFWKKGIGHMDDHESIVTIGMRGDGDMPMTEGSNIALLEKIVRDQRRIIREVTGKDPSATPQAWALYKEVQDYYDKGMRVPDDVTLLLCDDNWGNVRKLPRPGDKPRPGGYGMYYHFDYVGDPRNYKWINTNPISRVWEQMHLTWQYGVDRIWIVNVGDIKPMEFPLEFFLDYAWDPARWPADSLEAYTRNWATQQFGPDHAVPIADILTKYTRFNGRRKPELLSPDTYSLLNYREAETVMADYNDLAGAADSLYRLLPSIYRDAYYQLVLYPVLASANLNELYITVAKNRLYASQGRSATNELADRARALFANDSILAHYYNKEMAGGKWDHMMDQTHIGYTYWQQPPINVMPEVKTLDLAGTSVSNTSSIGHPPSPAWGVAIEGSAAWWPGAATDVPGASLNASGASPDTSAALLPAFDANQPQPHYLEIFNRGLTPFNYTLATQAPWLHVSAGPGTIDRQQRRWVSVDFDTAPSGTQRVPLIITGPDGRQVTVIAIVNNTRLPGEAKKSGAQVAGTADRSSEWRGFVEANGYVSIEAEHYTKAYGAKVRMNETNDTRPNDTATTTIKWQRIPGLGRTFSGMTVLPVTAPPQAPGNNSPRLEYQLQLFDTGTVRVLAYCSPLLEFNGKSLHYGISFDDEPPMAINLTANNEKDAWGKMVSDNIRILTTTHHISQPGQHVLKYWMIDPGVVLQKLVLDAGGVKPSYLGPPESPFRHGAGGTDGVRKAGGAAGAGYRASGLKDYYRSYFPIGVAVSPRSILGQDSALIIREFNSLTPENAMKMGPIHPEEGHYNWKDADAIVNFAQVHGMRVRGHNLCWHEQTPAWLFTDKDGRQVTKEVLLQRLKEHITAVVSRYKGKIYAWDVVNEAIDDDSAKFLRESPWYRICGDQFIAKAFEYAHQADPSAQLFYNDYNTERPEKRERVYKLLKQLVAAGVPVTGVGLQAHWSIYEPSEKELKAAIDRFASLGIKVQITELDVSIYPWEKNMRTKRPGESDSFTAELEQKQLEQYRKIFAIFRSYKDVITGVTFWNVSDRHTWLDNYPVPGRKNYPLLFDTELQPKKAYRAVTDF